MTAISAARDRRRCALLGAVALAAPVLVLQAGPATAASRETTRFSLAAQGDAMFYEANSQNAPGSPKNQAGSLTARAQNNSAGDSFAFAGAPYGGPTVTTLPGTGSGLVTGLTGQPVPLPFTTLPAYVTSRFPSDPSAEDDKGAYRIKSTSSEFASAAAAEHGGPAPSPNQQQQASAKTEARPDGSVVAVAASSVNGITAGPLTGITSHTTATITENGNRKPVITSTASGSFGIAGMTVAFDKKGFRLVGRDVPAKEGLAMINTALKNANIRLTAVPNATTIDKVSGATVHTIGGLQMTTVQSSPATEPATIDYVFARVQISSVAAREGDAGATGSPVVRNVEPAAASNGGGVTSVTAPPAAPAAESTADAPALTAETPVEAGSDTAPVDPALAATTGGAEPPAGAPVEEAPTVLGAVQPQGLPVRSESSLLYLALVLAGLGTVLGSQLFSRYGVLLHLREAVAGGRSA